MQEKEDTRFLDVLRWFATVAVVFYHVLNIALSDVEIDRGVEFAYNLIAVPMHWHVPMFLMISGALFLNPAKEISYRQLFTKNIRRLLLALGVFGIPMALMKEVFNERAISFAGLLRSVYLVFAGQTWRHMWFLYMLIGLYLLTPMLKTYVNNASKKEKLYLILLIFAFTGLKPTIEEYFNINIGFDIPISSGALGYYLLGHFMMYEVDTTKTRTRSITGICASLAVIWLSAVFEWGLPLETNSPVITVLTLSLFSLAKSLKLHSAFLSRTKYLAFGVYLTHMVFIFFAYRFLGISPFDYPAWLIVPVFGTAFFAMSLVSSIILNKIPILKKYVM